jgi:ACR3 family arsenite transporter
MWKTLAFFKKNLVWSVLAFMALGILAGYFFRVSFLQSTIIPLTFLMVYPMMVTLNIKKVFSRCDTKTQTLAQLLNFAVIPFAAFAIGSLLLADHPLWFVGLLLIALLPTSGMTISWTGFAKGNMEVAIRMTVIGLVLGSVLTPLYIKFLMGEVVTIPLPGIFKQIALIVFLPMLAGYLTQRFIISGYGPEKYHKSIKQKFPLLSIVGLLGIVFVAMALKSRAITANPAMLLSLLVPLILFYGFCFVFPGEGEMLNRCVLGGFATQNTPHSSFSGQGWGTLQQPCPKFGDAGLKCDHEV